MLRYIIKCPDGIVIVTWILCYLSEVVVLKLKNTNLYLECWLLDMRTGAPDFAPGEYASGGDSYRNNLASDYESAARMSRQQEAVHIGSLNEPDVFVSGSDEICEIIWMFRIEARTCKCELIYVIVMPT